jgi:hypothetical protein
MRYQLATSSWDLMTHDCVRRSKLQPGQKIVALLSDHLNSRRRYVRSEAQAIKVHTRVLPEQSSSRREVMNKTQKIIAACQHVTIHQCCTEHWYKVSSYPGFGMGAFHKQVQISYQIAHIRWKLFLWIFNKLQAQKWKIRSAILKHPATGTSVLLKR